MPFYGNFQRPYLFQSCLSSRCCPDCCLCNECDCVFYRKRFCVIILQREIFIFYFFILPSVVCFCSLRNFRFLSSVQSLLSPRRKLSAVDYPYLSRLSRKKSVFVGCHCRTLSRKCQLSSHDLTCCAESRWNATSAGWRLVVC